MKRFALVLLAAALLGCGAPQRGADADAGCIRSAAHEVTWTRADAPDVVTTSSMGPSCAQAVVVFVARNAGGDPLWTFASTYNDLKYGGAPAADAPAPNDAEIDAFLRSWADVTESSTAALPEWRADAPTLSESAATFAYETPFDRETYEALRGRDLPMICYAAAAEATQCLIVDPLSQAPVMIAAYGP